MSYPDPFKEYDLRKREEMTDKLSERMSSGSFSFTNDGVLTCDECGREPDRGLLHCSSHEDLQNKKEVVTLEQRVEELEGYKKEVEAVAEVMYQFTMKRLASLEKN